MNFELMRQIEVLLVEDNPADVRLMQEAFKKGADNRTLHIVPDGEQALAYLRRQEPFSSAKRPDLILLDLKMPQIDGREVLAEIKGDPELRKIPVIVFSSSDTSEDIQTAYRLHANCFVSKPANMQQFVDVVNLINEHWAGIVQLPPKE
jgi:CheY-like chemotaxis protein